MKKLMTMLSAAAMAFGLFAEGEPVVNGTSFEGSGYPEGAITAEALNTAENGAATWTVADGKVTVTAYGAETPYTGGRPNQFENDDQDKYLAVKTALGTEFATRAAAVTAGDAGLYADMLVKFTAAEDAPAIPSGTKVAVWLKENEGENDAPSTYNLMVSAGYLADGVVVVTNYDCGNYEGDLDAWHRVTIKSIANIYESGDARDGFAIWVDKTIVGTDDEMSDDGDDWKANLNENAGEFAKEGNLFISADANVTGISAVAFSGSGSVDDISVTQVLPFDDAADKKAMKFTVNGEEVASIEDAFEAAAEIAGQATIAPVATYVGDLVITTPIEIDTVATGNSIVLDLAGKTITFRSENEEAYAISVVGEGAKLTITDSSTTTLGCLDSNQGAVIAVDNDAVVNITAGGIKGGLACDALDGAFNISGGEFTADPEDFVAEGYKVDDSTVEGYNYSVVKQVFVNVTVTQGENTTLTVEGVESGKAEVGETLTVTAALTDPTAYFGLAVTVDGEAITLDEQGQAEVTVKSTDMTIASSAKKIVAKINGKPFASLAEAVGSNDAVSNTVLLVTDTTVDCITSFKDGSVIDFGGNKVTGSLSADLNKKYLFQISKNLNVTFKNGSIEIDKGYTKLTTIFQNYANITVEDVAIDATNLTGKNEYWDCAAVFAVMNGNVVIRCNTSIANNNGYALSIGNHAGADYLSRAVTLNTTGTLAGNFLFAGGAVTNMAATFSAGARFDYGSACVKTNNLGECESGTCFAIGDLEGFNLHAGVGIAPVYPSGYPIAATYKVCGQLYADVAAAAEAAASTDKSIVLFENYALTADREFNNAVAVVAPAKITLDTFKLTVANQLVIEDVFTDENVKESGEGPYTYKVETAPVDPIDGPVNDDGAKAVTALKAALEAAGSDINAYATAVYGVGGKIPAEKLNATTESLAALAAQAKLKIMASPVALTTAKGATDKSFTFSLSDANGDNPLVTETLAQKLVQYTDALGVTPFAPSDGDAVTVALDKATPPASFTATLTGNDLVGEPADAGFMKVEIK